MDLSALCERDGRRLIMVIAGLPSIDDRKAEAEKLLDWGLSKFRAIEVYAEGDRVGKARVWGGNADWVDLVTKDVLQRRPDQGRAQDR